HRIVSFFLLLLVARCRCRFRSISSSPIDVAYCLPSSCQHILHGWSCSLFLVSACEPQHRSCFAWFSLICVVCFGFGFEVELLSFQ
uniref:Secreted protein n=1 Tax=Triticum urartu TaxID=4572 RepID=A0A8R7TQE9_TRIUA